MLDKTKDIQNYLKKRRSKLNNKKVYLGDLDLVISYEDIS